MSENEPETPLPQSYFVLTGAGLIPDEVTAAIGIRGWRRASGS